jgi:hypothetical protein
MAVSLIRTEDCRRGGDALDRVAAPERAAYLREFLRLGPAALAGTRPLERCVLEIEGKPVPVIVNDGSERDCYVLSPYAHYVKYMLIELRKIRGLTARALEQGVALLGKLVLPLGFNRCVSVNNWLFTTSPELRLNAAELEALTRTLLDRYRDLPLVIRCVDARDAATRELFESAGYRLVVNRPVHEWDAARLNRHHRRNLTSDIRMLDDPRFTLDVAATLGPGDEDTIYRLYTALYVHKHVGYNCRYTAQFFRVVHDTAIMRFTTIRHADQLIAFCTSFADESRSVAALVGYATELDRRQFPLYRMAVAEQLRWGMERRRIVFLSTGAAAFKRHRGSYEWLEYEAVYDRHLPPQRRIPWRAFGALLDSGTKSLNTGEL